MRVKATKSAGGFDVTGDGAGLEGRAGLSLPAQLANQIGLTGALRQVSAFTEFPSCGGVRFT